MTARTRTRAACDASVAADMTPFRTVPMPVDVTDAAAFPEIALARASLAARPAEERERLEKDWL